MNHAARVKKLEDAINPSQVGSVPCDACRFPESAVHTLHFVGSANEQDWDKWNTQCPVCNRLLNVEGRPLAEDCIEFVYLCPGDDYEYEPREVLFGEKTGEWWRLRDTAENPQGRIA